MSLWRIVRIPACLSMEQASGGTEWKAMSLISVRRYKLYFGNKLTPKFQWLNAQKFILVHTTYPPWITEKLCATVTQDPRVIDAPPPCICIFWNMQTTPWILWQEAWKIMPGPLTNSAYKELISFLLVLF